MSVPSSRHRLSRPGSLRHRGRRIGLLGGSFNPAHDGHRYISRVALTRLGLDEVWWLVSPQNPLKSEVGMAPFESRLESAKRVARDRRIRVSAIETALGTRFTADTLNALQNRYPAAKFVWLMGADNLVQISRWRAWTQIFSTMPIAVFARDSYDSKALSALASIRFRRARLPERAARLLPDAAPPAWVFLRIEPHPATATELRQNGAWPASSDE
ncbi:MAG: nicotinate-nucleotide adenylyltransferase [Alphaproteobacteria bacterium]